MELVACIQYHDNSASEADFALLYPILLLLSYMYKVSLVKPGMDIVNSLSRQQNALDAFLKACTGLQDNSDLLLETCI